MVQVTAIMALTTEVGTGLPATEAYAALHELQTTRRKYRGRTFAGPTTDNAATKSKVTGLIRHVLILWR